MGARSVFGAGSSQLISLRPFIDTIICSLIPCTPHIQSVVSDSSFISRDIHHLFANTLAMSRKPVAG